MTAKSWLVAAGFQVTPVYEEYEHCTSWMKSKQEKYCIEQFCQLNKVSDNV